MSDSEVTLDLVEIYHRFLQADKDVPAFIRDEDFRPLIALSRKLDAVVYLLAALVEQAEMTPLARDIIENALSNLQGVAS